MTALRYALCISILTLSALAAAVAHASQCPGPAPRASTLAAWTHASSGASDFVLDLNLSIGDELPRIAFSFTAITLSGDSFFGDERSVFTIGSTEPRLYEPLTTVRIGSTMQDAAGAPRLLIASHETTIAQYAGVVGNGNLADGLRSFVRLSGTPIAQPILSYLDPGSPCMGTLSEDLAFELSKPVTGLTEDDYQDFLARVNETCFKDAACAGTLAGLSRNPDIPAYVRLPMGYEWEYAARGASEVGLGRSPDAGFVEADAGVPAGSSFSQHINAATPSGGTLRPTGERKPLAGFFDLFGNAQELVIEHFMSEAIFGAVGGASVRGGTYRSTRDELRASARKELPQFTVTLDSNGVPVPAHLDDTTVRLSIGLPISGVTERLGSDQLARIFAATYSQIGIGSDRAGNSFGEALALQPPREDAEYFLDEVGDADDPADYFRFPVEQYGGLKFETLTRHPLQFTLSDQLRQPVFQATLRPGAGETPEAATTPDLLPGRYYLSISPAGAVSDPSGAPYRFRMSKIRATDTGLQGNEIRREAFANAPTLSGNSGPFEAEGYVGVDDKFDTFAVEIGADHDGLLVELADVVGLVKVNVLDARGVKVDTREISPGGRKPYPIPLTPRMKAFVQIEAGEDVSTRYQLALRAARMYAPALSTRPPQRSETARNMDLEGYLFDSASTLYVRLALADRRKLRIELTGLHQNADLAIADDAGRLIESSHRQSGSDPELFEKDLASGEYVVAVTRKSGTGTITPFLLGIEVKAAAALTPQDLAEIKRAAKLVAPDGAAQLATLGSTAQFFYLNETADVRKIRLVVHAPFVSYLQVTIEDESGAPIGPPSASTLNEVSFDLFLGPGSGRAYLRVEPARSGPIQGLPVGLSVHAESNGGMESDQFALPASRREGAWGIAVDGDVCYAATAATEVAPVNRWLNSRPLFEVVAWKRSSSVRIVVDASLDQKKPFVARILDSSGKWKKVNLAWYENRLWPVTYVRAIKDYSLNMKAVTALRRAKSLEITGLTPAGVPARLLFDLSGIDEAMAYHEETCKLPRGTFR